VRIISAEPLEANGEFQEVHALNRPGKHFRAFSKILWPQAELSDAFSLTLTLSRWVREQRSDVSIFSDDHPANPGA
jgi:hypothetical protein